MVHGNGEAVFIEPPQLGKAQLGLRTGVDEHDRHPGISDQPIDPFHGVHGHVPRPGHVDMVFGGKDADIGPRPGPAADMDHARRACHSGAFVRLFCKAGAGLRDSPRVRVQPVEQVLRVGDRRRQPHPAVIRREALQPRQTQTEQVPALVGRQRVQLVEDDAAQIAEESVAVLVGQQQRQALRCGHQDMRRALTLARAAVSRRVTRPRLGGDGQPHLPQRGFEISADVGRQRLERRNIERVQPLEIRLTSEFDQRGQKPRQRLAPTGRCSQQGRLRRLRGLEHGQLVGVGRPASSLEPAREGRRQPDIRAQARGLIARLL